MPKKPNYRFERAERDRLKAAKKAERLAAKQAKTEDGDQDESAPSEQSSEE